MSELKTPMWQRVAISIIAITMLGGTIIGMIFMVLATTNKKIDPGTIAREQQMKEYQKYMEESKKANEERLKNLEGLAGYADKIGAFDAKSINELKTETLKEGDGATIASEDTISANYTGWDSKGKLIDSTKMKGEDATPVEFSLSGVIKGWKEGLTGKKVGGVYLLTIPSDLAYGATGVPNGSIGPNEPLKFVVEIVAKKTK